MKRRLLGACAILVMSLWQTAMADPMVYGWSQSFGSASDQSAYDITKDASGNIIIVGELYGTVDFGGGPLVSAGGSDIFIAKFDAAGNHLWSKRFGDAAFQGANAVTTDAGGNIVVVGTASGTVDFGGGPIATAGNGDVFVARFSPAGGNIYSNVFGDANVDFAGGVAVDASNNIVVVGQFAGSIDFGGGMLTSAGNYDIFVAKINPLGVYIWSKSFGDVQYDYGQGVATDSAGNVILIGSYGGTVDFGGGPLVSAGSNDIVVAKFNGTGAHTWSKSFGNTGYETPYGIVLDDMDNIIVDGYFSGTVDFGGGFLPGAGLEAFLVEFDPTGAHVWSKSFGGSAPTQIADAVDRGANGDIVIAGYFNGDIDLGAGTVYAVGGWNGFVARYDATGNYIWSQTFGNAPTTYAYGVVMDAAGNVAVTGDFNGDIDFGGGNFTSSGFDAYLAKFWQTHEIVDVSDVPGDQGGQVNIAWDAFGADTPAEHAITDYTLWRGITVAAYSALVESGATVSAAPPTEAQLQTGAFVRVEQTEQATYYWQLMKTVPAYYLPNYYDQVPTQFDSTSVSNEYQYFQIIAHTANPYVFYVSDPDSGYSVDNLPPAMVINLTGEQVSGPGGLAMTWSPNTEADLDHYVVYRSTTPDFVPGPGNVIGMTTDPTLEDGSWTWDSGYYYKVAAVDEHGNEGKPALLGPGFVVGVEPVSVPERNFLGNAMPNPFNPTTTIAYGLKEGAHVTLRIYDASGQLVRTLVDGLKPAGPGEVTWFGRDDQGRQVASGVYFYRLETGTESFSRKMVLLK